MCIDAIGSDLSNWEEICGQQCQINGSQVYILDEKNAIRSLYFETRVKDSFSLKDRKDGIKPMMQRPSEINLGYKRTNSDGSANEVTIGLKFEKDPENSSSTNNENDNKASDIDSRDRDNESDKR